jgi:serine protease Do
MTRKHALLRRIETGTVAGVIAALMVAGATVGYVSQGNAATNAPTKPLSAPANAAMPTGFSKIVEQVGPAVVSIVVQEKAEKVSAEGGDATPQMPEGMQEFMQRFFGQDWQKRLDKRQGDNSDNGDQPRWKPIPHRPQMGAGSGFIIDKDGYIVTNNHVAGNASSIKVVMQDGTEYDAKLIGADKLTDLALIKVEADKPLPYVAFSNETAPKVGDWVVTIGNPFGLGNTVTAGIISAHHRHIGEGPYDDFIQIDAPINKGNSGGPAFNTKGEVIGINTAIFSPTGGSVGIGFAIPASSATKIIAKLKENGRVDRGWLGVEIQPVNNSIAEGLGLDKAKGAIVARVIPDGPAAKAGVESGDVILSVNGEEVTAKAGLPALVAAVAPGEKAKFQILRNGKEKEMAISLGTREEQKQVAALTPKGEKSAFGMKLSRLDPKTRDHFGLEPDVKGVVITDIDPSSDAAAKGLEVGDVIVQVSGKSVDTPADIEKSIAVAKDSHRKAVLLLVRKEDQQRYVALPVRKA